MYDIEDILKVVAEYTKISVEAIKGSRRYRATVYARHLYFHVSHHQTNSTLKSIGYLCSKRDHSTVIHGLECIENYLSAPETAKKTANDILKIVDMLLDLNNEVKETDIALIQKVRDMKIAKPGTNILLNLQEC